MTIKEFYDDLFKEIKSANTKKYLMFLKRRSEKFKDKIINESYSNKSTKNKVNNLHKQALKLISKIRKKL